MQKNDSQIPSSVSDSYVLFLEVVHCTKLSISPLLSRCYHITLHHIHDVRKWLLVKWLLVKRVVNCYIIFAATDKR